MNKNSRSIALLMLLIASAGLAPMAVAQGPVDPEELEEAEPEELDNYEKHFAQGDYHWAGDYIRAYGVQMNPNIMDVYYDDMDIEDMDHAMGGNY